MKNKLIKFIITSCALCSTLLVSCNSDNSSGGKVYPQHVDKVFNKIDVNLVENGKTDYKIVLPATPTSEEIYASRELQQFVLESSGVNIEIASENTVEIGTNFKYIALGDTQFVAMADITLDKDVLGESGYYLKTVDNTIVIAGFHEVNYYGTLYGVYDFLKYTIGFEVYAGDEIYFKKLDTINLFDFNEFYRPTFDMRCIEYRACNADKTYQKRMRYIQNSDYWCSYTHTLLTVYLNPKTYGKEHPEYYNTSQTQLCYGEPTVVDALAEAVKKRLTNQPNTEYCMLGQEDNWDICHCPKCEALMDKFGTLGGVELDFTNRVAQKVDSWLHEAYPGRKVTYVFFAYNQSKAAPCDENGNPFNPNLKPYENTGVMIAPIAMDFGSKIDSPNNEAETIQVRNWAKIFNNKNIFVWSYCIQSRSNFFHMPNFGVQREFYQLYDEIGTKMLYDQGCYQMNCPCFQAMRTYISAKMMWDITYDYYALAEDFINHYYGEAAPAMIEYFYFLVSYYAYLRDAKSVTGRIFMMIDDKQYWPRAIVDSMLEIFDRALALLEPLKNTNTKRYEDLCDRVQIERCSPLYAMCNFYRGSLSKETKNAYLDDLEYYTTLFEIKGTQEGAYNVAGLISEWRK